MVEIVLSQMSVAKFTTTFRLQAYVARGDHTLYMFVNHVQLVDQRWVIYMNLSNNWHVVGR
jgi:hypothetical protein